MKVIKPRLHLEGETLDCINATECRLDLQTFLLCFKDLWNTLWLTWPTFCLSWWHHHSFKPIWNSSRTFAGCVYQPTSSWPEIETYKVSLLPTASEIFRPYLLGSRDPSRSRHNIMCKVMTFNYNCATTSWVLRWLPSLCEGLCSHMQSLTHTLLTKTGEQNICE